MNYFRCGGGRSTHTATKIDVAKTPLATFESNVSGLYLPEILAYFSATQAGTGDPSPSNPRAISGVSEVTTACNAINQWDEEWEVGLLKDDGTINTTQTTRRTTSFIPVLPNTAYYQVAPSKAFNGVICYYDNNKNLVYYNGNGIQNYFTTDNNTYYVRISFGYRYGTTYNNDISINYPATDTAYHAYTGTTATTALGGTYYGGYVNVTTGLLTIDRGMVKISDINWTGITSNPPIFRGVLSSIPNIQLPPNNAVPTTAITESFGAYAYSPASSSTIGKFAVSDAGSNRIVFIDDSVNTLAAFLQKYGDDILVYPLATPLTYQLTPAQIEQLLGQNNVFCSTGDVAVKYWKID